jgi:hypothetical protein
MDADWIYGAEPENVFTSIARGRPNGMPAFGTRIPEYQMWQLVAYVRSMTGLVETNARPGRNDAMQANHRSSSPTNSRRAMSGHLRSRSRKSDPGRRRWQHLR